MRSYLRSSTFVLLVALVGLACSSDDPASSDPDTLSPDDVFPLGTTVTITQSGNYNLPASAARLSWTCTGNVYVDVQSQIGPSQQECNDGSQSIAVEGPGVVVIQLVAGASLEITATS